MYAGAGAAGGREGNLLVSDVFGDNWLALALKDDLLSVAEMVLIPRKRSGPSAVVFFAWRCA